MVQIWGNLKSVLIVSESIHLAVTLAFHACERQAFLRKSQTKASLAVKVIRVAHVSLQSRAQAWTGPIVILPLTSMGARLGPKTVAVLGPMLALIDKSLRGRV